MVYVIHQYALDICVHNIRKTAASFPQGFSTLI